MKLLTRLILLVRSKLRISPEVLTVTTAPEELTEVELQPLDTFRGNFFDTCVRRILQSQRPTEDCQVLHWRKKGWTHLIDWGTIIVGSDMIKERFLEEVLSLAEGSSFIMTTPSDTTLPKILATLGAFPSISQARKNGWKKSIPSGISYHYFKISGARGELMIINVPGSDWCDNTIH